MIKVSTLRNSFVAFLVTFSFCLSNQPSSAQTPLNTITFDNQSGEFAIVKLMGPTKVANDKQWQLAEGHVGKAKDPGLQASNTILSEIKNHVQKDITTKKPNKAKLESEGTADKALPPVTANQPKSCDLKMGKSEQIEKIINELGEGGPLGLIKNLFNLISSIVSWILFSIFCLLGI